MDVRFREIVPFGIPWFSSFMSNDEQHQDGIKSDLN